ncbi:hypothetical protein Hanom_Chr04g00294101 [Helianthus anomalus]
MCVLFYFYYVCFILVKPLCVSPMATSPHSNPEVAGSSLARSQCPYGSGFTPRLRLAG